MERIILNDINIHYGLNNMAELKNIDVDSLLYKELIKVSEIATQYIHPKAILTWADMKILDPQHIWIEGETFESKLLVEKLKNHERVFVTVITAGEELNRIDIIQYSGGSLMKNAIELFKYAVLTEARTEVRRYIKQNFGYENMAALNPGSLPDWPIRDNKKIFNIMGDVEKDIDVFLTADYFMTPKNTVSGILFANEENYINCSLCKKNDCVGRKAKFDLQEYKDIFG